jgi:hypothetical protein
MMGVISRSPSASPGLSGILRGSSLSDEIIDYSLLLEIFHEWSEIGVADMSIVLGSGDILIKHGYI